ncbi:hypothetical protein [Angustibacter luteus]|uniref:HK97 gp10 family phage protein n=1 Tax=Angustibacter luteus TaxID=658456 RepID=A0ABW1JKG1_9ACTN
MAPAELHVQAENLHQVYAKVKAVGDGELRKRVTRGIREATQPMKDAVKASALAELPHRGGLNQLVARSRISNSVRTSSRSAGVQLKATNDHDIKAMDRGRLRHPTFGRTGWVTQKIGPGWWSRPLEKTAPQVRDGIQKALNDIGRDIS